ncbi:MAG: Band 7 protein, partial [Gammaproteobacteria bacterium]|nr:Band 7 protein [Gammaproteobacteria bacterium]
MRAPDVGDLPVKKGKGFNMVGFLGYPLLVVLLVLVLYTASTIFRTVPQATVGVVTVFGKYHRIMREGLNLKMPW